MKEGEVMAQKVEQFQGVEDDDLKLTFIGRHLHVTDALKIHIMDRMRRVERITPQVIDVTIYLEVEKNVHRVEILYKFSHFKVVTKGAADDMYQAFHLAVMRLRRKLSKWKTRIQDHHAKNLAQAELSVNVLDRAKEDLDEINDDIEEENFLHVEQELQPAKIVKHKKRSLKTLTTDEAIMKMELTDDHFMVYRSEEDQKIKVIYVRRDKTVGVIEVE